MNTRAPVAVATSANMSVDVDQVQVLFRVVLVAQWYSSEREPPGNRRVWLPFSCRSEVVAAVSKLESQTAALTPNIRASTTRTWLVASTFKWTIAGAGFGLSCASST